MFLTDLVGNCIFYFWQALSPWPSLLADPTTTMGHPPLGVTPEPYFISFCSFVFAFSFGHPTTVWNTLQCTIAFLSFIPPRCYIRPWHVILSLSVFGIVHCTNFMFWWTEVVQQAVQSEFYSWAKYNKMDEYSIEIDLFKNNRNQCYFASFWKRNLRKHF